MKDIVISFIIGAIVYAILSVVIDSIMFVVKSLNRKQIGALGMVFNTIILAGTSRFQAFFPNEIVFLLMIVVSIINIIISVVQFVLGMMSCDGRY